MVERNHLAVFRFYAGLNDFLPLEKRGRDCAYRFRDRPAIKDPIEALGVPHTEVDLVLVNGVSVGFDYGLRAGDRVAVYPPFVNFDIEPIAKLRDKPPRPGAFMLDVHLGKLARMLRFLGFDTRYENHCADPEIVQIAVDENRIVLTRDRRLLFRKEITYAYYVRSSEPMRQVIEVLDRFDLYSQQMPFHRCTLCNGEIKAVAKEQILDRLEPKTILYYDRFYRCEACRKIYWRGSHYGKIEKRLNALLAGSLPRRGLRSA